MKALAVLFSVYVSSYFVAACISFPEEVQEEWRVKLERLKKTVVEEPVQYVKLVADDVWKKAVAFTNEHLASDEVPVDEKAAIERIVREKLKRSQMDDDVGPLVGTCQMAKGRNELSGEHLSYEIKDYLLHVEGNLATGGNMLTGKDKRFQLILVDEKEVGNGGGNCVAMQSAIAPPIHVGTIKAKAMKEGENNFKVTLILNELSDLDGKVLVIRDAQDGFRIGRIFPKLWKMMHSSYGEYLACCSLS